MVSILSLKVLLISAAAVSLAAVLRFSFPTAVDGIPATWSFILSWLKPPYLYLIINAIIITIAASSRLHHRRSDSPPHRISADTPETFESFSAHPDITADPIAEIEDANGLKVDFDSEEAVAEEAEDGDVFVDWALKHARSPPEEILQLEPHFPAREEILQLESRFSAREEMLQLESQFPAREKPLVRSRFGQRKPIRATAEGKKQRTPNSHSMVSQALGVAKAKKQETLESTWKMITEGRHVPLNRHLKKTETLEEEETKIGKEVSKGQEELNRRVEAFIKKFNEDMRIQRQESMKQYMEMINRGV